MKTFFIMMAFAVFLGSTTLTAGTIAINWSTDKEPVSYLPGQTMTFNIQLVEDGKPLAGKTLQWVRTGDDQKTAKGEAVSSDTQPLEITTSINKPGFVHLVVTVLNSDGSRLGSFEGGAGASPEKLTGVPEPVDFDAYWTGQKDRLAQVPMKVLEMNPVPETIAGVLTYDVKVACAGGAPVSGYFSKRADAAPKSSAALVMFQSYGAHSAYRLGGFAADPKKPTIALCINAHGIENGHDDAYYKNLDATTLKGYGFNPQENASPETAYFNGMVLRLLRALEFIKAQPEWDGKTLVVSGGSQGGFQCLIAAGLDQAVTRCDANKPWCCDLGGPMLGRLAGWRPMYTEALGYFDPINHAKRIRGETFIISCLGDYVSPPSGLSVLYNNIKAPKTIEYIQGATHPYTPPNPKKQIISSK
jgi:cephalosporin-C deacetylase-like acetyl esterase